VEQSSAEDLATAERYLNGGQGKARDSREAASWLWKAVSKGNPTATLTLSDLYLRGDGVPKNCDQAHLLLDAAARKGVHAAAERLRNLQAFGCQ
jgi:TPR repeat protein